METNLQRCAHCGADTAQDRAAGLTYCSVCGRDPALESASPPLDADDRADQRRWRVGFWLFFLVTPVAVFLCGASQFWISSLGIRGINLMGLGRFSAAGVLGLGLLGAGYCRLKLEYRTRQSHETFSGMVLRAAGILLIYSVLAACVVASLSRR